MVSQRSYFGSGGQGKDDVSGEFTWDKKQYQVSVRRGESRTIYSIVRAVTNQPPQVVAVGEIKLGVESKPDARGDPFVVVIRTGNYLQH